MWRGLVRYLRPWATGGSIWLVLSFWIVLAQLQRAGGEHVRELWFLLSLLWAEFGFAGVYHCLRHRQGRDLGPLLLTLLIPPAILYLVIVWLTEG